MLRWQPIRRKALAYHRLYRELRMIGKGLVSKRHVLLAHVIPIRRCNLSCKYCNEYDDVSKPVPTNEMFGRIDNLVPDEVSKKSLKVLDKKLQLLAEHADFHVNINSVVGGGIRNPEDALVVARRAVELGLTSTVGIIHDNGGQMRPLNEVEQRVYRAIKAMGKRSYARVNQ